MPGSTIVTNRHYRVFLLIGFAFFCPWLFILFISLKLQMKPSKTSDHGLQKTFHKYTDMQLLNCYTIF